MLFSYYDKLYITEDKRTIKTGDFKFNKYKGFYLEKVDIEESDNEIKIHGWQRGWAYHSDDFDLMFCGSMIPESTWRNYCILSKDRYFHKTKKWFIVEKVERRLRGGNYMFKKAKEICFVFHKTELIEEYSK